MRSERERLSDILEAIERIEKYAAKGRGAFVDDELIQNWMVHTSPSSAKLAVRCRMISKRAGRMFPGRLSSA